MSGPRDPRRQSSGAEVPASESRHGELTPGPLDQSVFWIAWWVVLAVLWLLLVDKLKGSELIAGALAAAVGATFSTLVRARSPHSFRLRARWMLGLWRLPPQAALDVGVLAAALWRHLILRRSVSGAFRAVPFRATGEDAEATARRATTAGAVSFTPNTYVLDVDRERGFILVHQLVPKPGDRKSADPLELG